MSWVLVLRKLDQNLLLSFSELLWAKFSAAYVMRRAYPVCPNTPARIFLQHPPTINTYPELSNVAHKRTAKFSRCSKGLSIIYLDITTAQQLYSKSAEGEFKGIKWWLVAHSASLSSAPLRYWVIAAGAEGSDGWMVIEEIWKIEVWWHGGSLPLVKKTTTSS